MLANRDRKSPAGRMFERLGGTIDYCAHPAGIAHIRVVLFADAFWAAGLLLGLRHFVHGRLSSPRRSRASAPDASSAGIRSTTGAAGFFPPSTISGPGVRLVGRGAASPAGAVQAGDSLERRRRI
ncbi:hypothetical protein [Streptomyces sp. NPDC003863]